MILSHLCECRDFSPALLWSLKVYQNQQMPSGTVMISATTYNSDFQLHFFFGLQGFPLLPCELTCAFKIIVATLPSICRYFTLEVLSGHLICNFAGNRTQFTLQPTPTWLLLPSWHYKYFHKCLTYLLFSMSLIWLFRSFQRSWILFSSFIFLVSII